jgi:hypothetical protein
LETRCGGVFPERPRKTDEGRVRSRKTGISEMTFTGTLIDDLMATVERAEQKAQSNEPLFAEPMVVETWFSIEENTDYDSKFLGVA